MTWEQEVDLLKRELARAHASLKLEEARNAGLPELAAIRSPEEFQKRGNEAITRYLDFLKKRDLYPMRDSMDPALRAKIGEFVPLEQRNFFAIATHLRPANALHPLQMVGPCAQARSRPETGPEWATAYNIWIACGGMATVMEEYMLHAGLFDEERVRGKSSGSCCTAPSARAGSSTHSATSSTQAGQGLPGRVHARGWMRPTSTCYGFEQQLYLPQRVREDLDRQHLART